MGSALKAGSWSRELQIILSITTVILSGSWEGLRKEKGESQAVINGELEGKLHIVETAACFSLYLSVSHMCMQLCPPILPFPHLKSVSYMVMLSGLRQCKVLAEPWLAVGFSDGRKRLDPAFSFPLLFPHLSNPIQGRELIST